MHPCTACSKRKVKCDRRSPCSRCLTTGRECEQPEARRTPRKPRKAPDGNVLDRIRQLENTLQEMRELLHHADASRADISRVAGHGIREGHGNLQHSSSSGPSDTLNESFEKLLVEENKTRYVSSSSWANIADQVCKVTSRYGAGATLQKLIRAGL